MSISGLMFSLSASVSDRKRDRAIPLPAGITQCRNIAYGPGGKWNLLDVYYPDGTAGPLPTIASVHGGGYVYGTKELYRRYGMDMAGRGFAFVNFNYRLAPKHQFPAPLWDTNAVMEWLCANAQRYHLDPQRIILVGDSAGAQIASQYAAIWSDPDYAALFHMTLPAITIRCLGLYCGIYDPAAIRRGTSLSGLARDYLGKLAFTDDPRLKVLEAMGPQYPPAFIATAHHDFLRDNARPLFNHLKRRGVPCGLRIYGASNDKTVGHVFHVNLALPEAKRCNDESAAFFREYTA